jgi:hypothetical protein
MVICVQTARVELSFLLDRELLVQLIRKVLRRVSQLNSHDVLVCIVDAEVYWERIRCFRLDFLYPFVQKNEVLRELTRLVDFVRFDDHFALVEFKN